MTEARRRAYLEALGIDVWLAKPPAPEPGRLVVGPGEGSTLLVCATPEAASDKLANDIARAVGRDPVWAWPDPDGSPDRPTIEQAVGDRLFTQLLVFGDALASELFGRKPPGILHSAAVRVAPDLAELAVRGTAKRALWRLLGGGAD